MYGEDIEREIAELVLDATSFRFDASDLMPGEVGAGSFWKGMTDYVTGSADLDTALAEIDASWPLVNSSFSNGCRPFRLAAFLTKLLMEELGVTKE